MVDKLNLIKIQGIQNHSLFFFFFLLYCKVFAAKILCSYTLCNFFSCTVDSNKSKEKKKLFLIDILMVFPTNSKQSTKYNNTFVTLTKMFINLQNCVSKSTGVQKICNFISCTKFYNKIASKVLYIQYKSNDI